MGDCKGYPYDLPPMIDCGDIKAERKLFADAHCAIEKAKELNAKTEQILHHIKHFGLENGVWYSPKSVRTETAQAENLSEYTVTTIKNRDECGDHIFIKVHTAYGNTIDNGLKEPITSAVINECAQIITPAMTGNKFNGYTVVDGEIYPADVDENGYTVGFNFKNIMTLYKNADLKNDIERLKRDRIMQSVGCGVPFLLNGEVVETAVADDETAPRTVVAQDSYYNTYILTTVDGLTLTDCANILIKLGCVKAVELAKNAENSVVLDCGNPTISTANITTPQVAYFYVTKKDFFKNRFQWDICRATLTASICLATSNANLNEIKALENKHDTDIVDLKAKINDEVERATTAEEAIRNALDNVEESLTTRINDIEAEINTAKTTITEINETISNIQEKDTEQDGKITELYSGLEVTQQMITNVENALNEFKTSTTETLNTNTADIAQNKSDISTLKSTDELHTEQIKNVEDAQANIRELYTSQQAQLSSLDTALKTALNTISEIETTVNDIKNMYANLANLPDRMATIEESMKAISEQLPLLDQRLTAQSKLIEQNTSSITELSGKVDDLTNDLTENVSNINGEISETNKAVQNAVTKVSELDEKVSGYETRIATLESDNATNKSNISSNSDRITALENDNETNKTDIADLKSKVGTNTSDINSLKTNKADAESVIALETKVTENTENITTLESSVADNSSSIASAKSDITGLQNNKADKTAVTELETQVNKNTSDIAELSSRKIKIFSANHDYFTYDIDGKTLNVHFAMRPANIFEGVSGNGIAIITFDFEILKNEETSTLNGYCDIYNTQASSVRGIISGADGTIYLYRLGFSQGGTGGTVIDIALTAVDGSDAPAIAGQAGSDLRCCIIE